MLTPLTKAPLGISMAVYKVVGRGFGERMARLGVFVGTTLTRLGDAVSVSPVKVRGPLGEAVLSGSWAAKMVVHLDDDRRLPLLECSPGETGHVEGVTGQDRVAESMAALGLTENDRITFVRRLPPMAYNALADGTSRVRLGEGMASKLLGQTPSGLVQFCGVGVGEAFTVTEILAGENARQTFESLGVRPGTRLVLQSVTAGQVMRLARHNPVVCVTGDGLRLYFQEKDADRILVAPRP
jgi:Fe2+ transport system protein FeoA